MVSSVLIDTILRRVRDYPGQQAFGDATATRAVVLRYLSEAQRIVACAAGLLQRQDTLAVGLSALYQISSPLPGYTVSHVIYNSRRLRQCRWEELARVDRGWVSRRGEPKTWSLLGTDAILIVPNPPDGVLELIYTRVPAAITSEVVQFEVADEALPAIAAFAEALVLLQRRILAPAADALARAIRDLAQLGVETVTPPQDSDATS